MERDELQRWFAIAAIFTLGVSLITLSLTLFKDYTRTPVIACHYGVWDAPSGATYSGLGDPHVVFNGSGLQRLDSTRCEWVNASDNESILDSCDMAFPAFQYTSAEVVSANLLAPWELGQYMAGNQTGPTYLYGVQGLNIS